MKILIVDDSATMLRMIRKQLINIGYEESDQALDGSSALQKLDRSEYDLVIADWNMEPMTGLELLKSIKRDFELNKIPVIMMTPSYDEEFVTAAKQAGADSVIVKPLNENDLKEKIQSVLGT